jgi:hypothetical protein
MPHAAKSSSEACEDIRELFVRRFYFGCEADDPINSWAFQANAFDGRLGAVFGSDIGHFDVPDMTKGAAGGIRAG